MAEIDESKYGYIYKTKNLLSGHTYIGMHRIKKGERFDYYLGSGRKISNAIRKHGKESFSKEIVSYANSREELISMEIQAILQEEEYGGAQYNLYIQGSSLERMHNLTEVTNEDMFRMYFEEEKSTRDIAAELDVSQPVVVRFLKFLREEDERFEGIIERKVRNPAKRSEVSDDKRNETLKKQGTVECPKCHVSFLQAYYNEHTRFCDGTPATCIVCGKKLKKRRPNRCKEHIDEKARKTGLKASHSRWHVNRNIKVESCDLCVAS